MKLSTLTVWTINAGMAGLGVYGALLPRTETVLPIVIEAPAPLPAPRVIPAPPAIRAVIERAAHRHKLPADLVLRQAHRESSLRATVCSDAGACGLFQLMPVTAREVGVSDRFDAAQSAEGGALYLRKMIDRYHGNTGLGLAAYNAGPGRVDRWLAAGAKTDALPEETREYVKAITGKSVESWVLARLASI